MHKATAQYSAKRSVRPSPGLAGSPASNLSRVVLIGRYRGNHSPCGLDHFVTAGQRHNLSDGTSDMTESRQYVRVLLYGCSHKPRFSAMNTPIKGDTITCAPCRRARLVVGMETGWAHAGARCRNCPWKYANAGTKKKLFFYTHKHADARGHTLVITNDGYDTVIRPRSSAQIPLIDDLLLPD